MKKHMVVFAAFLFSLASIFAQEKVTVCVNISQDGKVIKDTTYTYNDLKEAKKAVKMMDMMSGDDFHFFHSENSDLHNSDSNHMKWVTKTVNEEGDSVKIIKIHKKGDGHSESHVWISGDGNKEKVFYFTDDDDNMKVHVIKDEDKDHEVISKKEIIMISDDGGDWTIEEGENGEIIMISKDGVLKKVKKEIHDKDCNHKEDKKWTVKECDEDEVIIIKKKKLKKGDEEIEVEVIMEAKDKKKNKS